MGQCGVKVRKGIGRKHPLSAGGAHVTSSWSSRPTGKWRQATGGKLEPRCWPWPAHNARRLLHGLSALSKPNQERPQHRAAGAVPQHPPIRPQHCFLFTGELCVLCLCVRRSVSPFCVCKCAHTHPPTNVNTHVNTHMTPHPQPPQKHACFHTRAHTHRASSVARSCSRRRMASGWIAALAR
jgi:hypothetical protein